jgi:hypothetical protein
MSYLKDREIWLSSVPTGNPPAGYVWVFIQNGVFVVRDSSGVDKIMASTAGSITTAATASYVQYSNVANKPTLVSGSAQVSFTGITNKPTLVSGSAQITYSGVSGKPEGIVSSSVQVKGYNVFATTGSNQFNGSQAITGSLTVTGQVVAQTLNVQQVTSSIVYSSGSNIFGNNSGNTHQFTGSMLVTGSMAVNGSLTGTSATFRVSADRNLATRFDTNIVLSAQSDSAAPENLRIYADTFRLFTATTAGGLTERFTVSNTGAATFSSSVTAVNSVLGNTSNDTNSIQINGVNTTRTHIGTGFGATFISNNAFFNGSAYAFDDNTLPNSQITLSAGIVSLSTGAANTDPTAKVTILNNGNVGIGETNPSLRLHVATGGGNLSGTVTYTTNTTGIVLTQDSGNSQWGNGIWFYNNGIPSGIASTREDAVSNWGTDLRFYIHPTPTTNQNTLTEAMRITSGGNVLLSVDKVIGLNTTDGSDTGYLAIAGASGDGANRGGHIYLSGNERVVDAGNIVIAAGNISSGTGAPGAIVFRTGDSVERMRINSDGNIRLFITPALDSKIEWFQIPTGNLVQARIWADGNPRFNVQVGGEGGVYLSSGATSWTGNSDERLKTINSNIENAVEKINTLRSVNFSWKSDPLNKENLGLIAQDIQAVFPQIVDTDKDGLMGVRYTELIPVLVKAIQELKSENDNLKSRLEVLEQS